MSEMPDEIWKIIPSLFDHEASSLGNIRGLDRFVKCRGGLRLIKKRQLKPIINPYGYKAVTIRKKSLRVHSLVAEAFIGPRAKGMQINHKDDNRTNNNLDNLEYVSQRENMNHGHKSKKGLPKGVSYARQSLINPYAASIQVNRKKIHLGHFKTQEAAHKAYCEAVMKIDGAIKYISAHGIDKLIAGD